MDYLIYEYLLMNAQTVLTLDRPNLNYDIFDCVVVSLNGSIKTVKSLMTLK